MDIMPMSIPNALGGGHFSAERSCPMPMIIVGTLGHYVVGAFKCKRSHPTPMTMPNALDGVYLSAERSCPKPMTMPNVHDHGMEPWTLGGLTHPPHLPPSLTPSLTPLTCPPHSPPHSPTSLTPSLTPLTHPPSLAPLTRPLTCPPHSPPSLTPLTLPTTFQMLNSNQSQDSKTAKVSPPPYAEICGGCNSTTKLTLTSQQKFREILRISSLVAC